MREGVRKKREGNGRESREKGMEGRVERREKTQK